MKQILILTVVAIVASGMVLGFADPCPGSTSPSQCAVVDAASAPPFVADTLIAQGAVPDAQCGDLLILSSGLPLDGDTDLDTDMELPGCGPNPDGFETNDCIQLIGFSPDANSLILAISSEWPEWEGSSFTDWMQIGGIVDMSINDWPGEPSLVDMPGYGPESSGSVTLATLAASQSVDLRIADSGDHSLDTAMIIVPRSCFENLEDPVLCGNGQQEQGEECDDGNNDDGDGCDSACFIEPFCGDGIVNQDWESCDGSTEVVCSDFGFDFGSVWCNQCLLEDDCYIDEVPDPYCGDGAVNQAPEECDDGNNDDGDGCSANCLIEPEPFCGDGIVNQDWEECDGSTELTCDDLGYDFGSVWCANCLLEDDCYDEEVPDPFCGDGQVNQAPEECDDGNNDDGDGCSANCLIEEIVPDPEIPEFTVIGAGLMLLGAGLYAYGKRK